MTIQVPKKKKLKVKKSFTMAFVSLFIKISLIILAIIVVYSIYLDQQIKERIDGNVWELPAAVYGQVTELEPDSGLSKKEVITLLDSSQYRQVTKTVRPGEFVVNDNNIELYRRPFQYPDVKEDAYRVKLYFSGNRLTRIQNIETGRDFGFFRIDPRLITMINSINGELRLFVPLNGFSDLLVETLLNTEDRRFYEHDGVSLFSIGRAIVANITAGRAVQGGSTLTQQLVKNLFLSNERSLKRKINEALMAVILDYRYGKERILELYLNEVFMGQDGSQEIHGFPLASQYYFGRPVNELSLDQQALLVGMVKGASYYNPWKHPQRALERRNIVLLSLRDRQIIDNELYETLVARPLGVLPRGGVLAPQPAFMQLVRQELKEKLGDNSNALIGAKIFTTLDFTAQNAAEKAVIDTLATLRKKQKIADLEGAMVVVNRITGEVKAIVGGSQPQYSGFNRALLARRSIGSLAKPPTYLTALSQPEIYRLNTLIEDEPISLDVGGKKKWAPKNYDRRNRGQVTLLKALSSSLNIPTVNLGMALGLEASAGVLRQLGVPENEVKPLPARLLGAINMTPFEVAQMYQTMANGGSRSPLSALRAVLSEDGEVIYRSYPQSYQTVSPQASYLTMYALQQVVKSGTAHSLTSKYGKYHLAGKTGTTNDLIDSWFAGIDGKDVAISWIGLDDNKPTRLTGSTGSLTLYQKFLEHYPPEELSLIIPEDIYDMQMTNDGDLVCSGGGITIPVWTSNPEGLCQYMERQATKPVIGQNNREVVDEEKEPYSSNTAPQWLKEMFDVE